MEAKATHRPGTVNNIAVWRRRLPRVVLRRAIAASVLFFAVCFAFAIPKSPMVKERHVRRQAQDNADVLRHPASVTVYTFARKQSVGDVDFNWTANPTTHFHGLPIAERKTYTDAAKVWEMASHANPKNPSDGCECILDIVYGVRVVGNNRRAVDILVDERDYGNYLLTDRGLVHY